MPSISEELQKIHRDSPLIELYDLDMTVLGGPVLHFTPHFADGGVITFGGVDYVSTSITSGGWEISATGTQPRPELTVAIINDEMLAYVLSLGDCVGATITRRRTFHKFTDGQAEANSSFYLLPDTYKVERKTAQTDTVISWELSSEIDRFGLRIPRRQITKDKFPAVGRQRGSF
jgi:lambda family phage minor tail protein L